MSEDQLISVKSRLQPFPVINLGRTKPSKDGWAMAFVYAPSGNYVVTGESGLVESYIGEKWEACLYYLSIWGQQAVSIFTRTTTRWPGQKQKKHRGYWSSKGIEIFERVGSPSKKHKYFGEVLSLKDYAAERDQYLFSPAPKSAHWRIGARRAEAKDCLFYRRLPRKWLPEWNKFVGVDKTSEFR